ncbi:MAG: hypothetical protein ACR2IS_20220 [Nitrososphaeraceae archaeon]
MSEDEPNTGVDAYLRPGDIIYTENIIRAIAELHRIELSLFSLYKQLPNSGLHEDMLIKTLLHHSTRRLDVLVPQAVMI